MFKLIKFSFSVLILIVLLVTIPPLLIDKEEIAQLVEDKVRKDLDINLTFDKNIGLNFFPHPTLKINSIEFFDKTNSYNIYANKINLIASWSSIFNFKPEIQSLEIFSPVVNINKNDKLTNSKNLPIFIRNENIDPIKKAKNLLRNFDFIKINNGLINSNDISLNNFNLIFKGKKKIELKGNFFIERLKSKVIFDLFEKNEELFTFIVQQKINNKNKIQYKGDLKHNNGSILINGTATSNFVNINDIFNFFSLANSFSKTKIRTVKNTVDKKQVNLDFDIKKVKINKIELDNAKFNMFYLDNILNIKNFKEILDKSFFKGNLKYSLKNKKVSGDLNFNNLYIAKDYFGLSKIDLFDGLVSCSILYKANLTSTNFVKILKSFNSEGKCNSGKIKISGIDLKEIAKSVDKVNDISSLINLINNRNFGKESQFRKINSSFNTKNGDLNILSIKAIHDNLILNSNGKYDLIKDNLYINSKAFFKTTKYKNLPALGIKVTGPSKDFKVAYNFEDLKQKMFNEGVKQILKEKKTIIVDPDAIKKFLNGNIEKELNVKKLFDLFDN